MSIAAKAKLSGVITKITFAALIIFYAIRFLWLAPSASDHPWVIWLIYTLPLIGFAPAVFRGTPRPHAWLCFVLLLYFLGAVVTAIQPHLAIFGWIESLLLMTLFTAAMLFARWQSRFLREQG